jgi:putative toxin-antitoxin system antitoxin component (TIGR02293 family)
LVRSAVEGIDTKLVLQFAKLVHLTVEKFTSFLDITRKTFDRKLSSNQPLSRSASEHSLSIFRLYWLGISTFGSVDEFTGWLHSPNYHLCGAMPVNYLNSITGISILEDMLQSIQYGDAL